MGHVTKLITPEGQGNLNYIGSLSGGTIMEIMTSTLLIRISPRMTDYNSREGMGG